MTRNSFSPPPITILQPPHKPRETKMDTVTTVHVTHQDGTTTMRFEYSAGPGALAPARDPFALAVDAAKLRLTMVRA